ncbi:extracellular solute-binding protein [Herbiconiux moechotypicola]|uniref:ABC transporter substrate-binding protein n=1 Tax=Herbiconiux moechotypicola TaxID=637393 RepID=A0ABP5QIU4_9MICO|nr:extracellular solute-binding protein [Herbiconiux moechotypicola]MCS5729999.1 extracellular solute-binding protein [Herbiconiux moechotypicola]
MKKRHAIAALTSVAALLALSACSSSSEAGTSTAAADGELSGSVTFAGYGGTGEEAARAAWFDPFTAETGVEVLNDSPVTWARVQEMVAADNVVWDVAQGGITQGVEDNPDLEMIDCDVVDCAAFDDAAFPIYPQAVPLFTFSQVVAYNTDTFGDDAPSGYADFFDPSVEGLRLMPSIGGNAWAGQLEAALLYDGVAREDLYPLDVDRALSVIDGIKDQMVIMTDDGQCISQVASGEAAMGICYNGRVGLAADEGQPVAAAWGQQTMLADYIYIPKGTPNLANAQALVAYIVENQGAIASQIAYGPINPNAPVDTDSPWLSYVPTENAEEGDQAPIVPDQTWWTENFDSVVEQLTAWAAS